MLNEKELTMQQVLNFCVPYKDSLSLRLSDMLQMQLENNLTLKKGCEEVFEEIIKMGYPTVLLENIHFKINSDGISKKYFSYDYVGMINKFLKTLGITNYEIDESKDIDSQVMYIIKKLLCPIIQFVRNNDELILKRKFNKFYSDYLNIKNIQARNHVDVSQLEKFKPALLKTITKCTANMTVLVAILSQPIDMRIFDGVDKSKLLLYVNKLLLEKCMKTDENEGKIDNDIFSVINYVEHKEPTGENVNIKYLPDDFNKYGVDKPKNYSYHDFLLKFREYINKHPKLKLTKVDLDYFNNYSFDEVNEFINTFFYEDMPTYNVGFIILPNGKSDMLKQKEIVATNEAKKIKIDFLAIQKRSYFSNTKVKPSMRLMGTGEWKNHIIYIYNNGNVVFELFDVNSDEFSSKSGAVYVTNVHKLGMFPNLTKNQVIEYIHKHKDGETIRKYHRGNWKEKISAYIEAPKKYEYDEIYAIVKEQCPNIQENKDVKHYVKGIS